MRIQVFDTLRAKATEILGSTSRLYLRSKDTLALRLPDALVKSSQLVGWVLPTPQGHGFILYLLFSSFLLLTPARHIKTLSNFIISLIKNF
jgi:hypothetical protein